MGAAVLCLFIAGMSLSGKAVKEDGIRFKTDDFTMMLFGLFRVSWEYVDGENSPPQNGFRCDRATIYMKLRFPKNHISLSTSFRTTKPDLLEDLYIDYSPPQLRKQKFLVRVGQMRVPFSIFGLISSRKVMFPKRPVALSHFYSGECLLGKSRDIGIMLKSEWRNFTLQIGGFNGQGINTLNPDDKLLGVARFEFAYPEPKSFSKRYTECELTYYKTPYINLGIAYAYNAAVADFDSDTDLDDAYGATADLDICWRTFRIIGALYYATLKEGRITGGNRYDRYTYGKAFQFSWLFSHNLSVGFRYSYFDPNVHYLHDWTHKETLVLNWYIAGRSRRMIVEVSRETSKQGPGNDVVTWAFGVMFEIQF